MSRIWMCVLTMGLTVWPVEASASPLALADYKTEAQRKKNAAKAASIALKAKFRGRGITRACEALEALGRLGHASDRVVAALDRSINASNHSDIQSCGGWALGEISTGMEWGQHAQALHQIVLTAMHAPLEPKPAYFVVEALGKLYIPHEHSTEDDIRTARALNALQASFTTQLPTLFYVVQGKIVNLNVAIELSRQALDAAKSGDSKDLIAAYQAELTLLRQLDRKRKPLLASFDQRQTVIRTAFNQTLRAFDFKNRPLSLVTAWYLADIARDPLFSDLVADSVARQANTDNIASRLVFTWSLGRMNLSRSSRTMLRDRVSTETNPLVLRALHESVPERRRIDALQSIYGIRPSPESSP